MMRSLQEMVGDRIVEILTEHCITNVEEPEYTAGLIRQGNLQDNPEKPRISIMVHPGDPNSKENRPAWSDKAPNAVFSGFEIATYEIGGETQRQWRRYAIQIQVLTTTSGETREQARRTGMNVFAMVQNAIRSNLRMRDKTGQILRDSFGEIALLMVFDSQNQWESGGPPASFIWRADIYVQVLTETNNPQN